MKTVIIDESSGNPFPTEMPLVDPTLEKFSFLGGFSDASTEGYHHDNQLIKITTKKLAELISLESGKKTIDIGYGSNLSVAEAMQELEMEAYGLDSQDGLDHEKYESASFVPAYFNSEQKGVQKYCGSIEEILDENSELKNNKFDLFTFWGSWESGGYNFAIGGEMGEFRIMKEYQNKNLDHPQNEELHDLMQKNKDKIISETSSMLNPDGGTMVISSRYARHGAGFTTEQLPWEKRIMLRLGQTFFDNGAKEVYFIGLSKNTVQKQMENYSGLIDIANTLGDDSTLFESKRGFYEAGYSEKMIEAIKDMQVPLGRIDAVYGRF